MKSGENKYSKEDFITMSNKKHNHKYNYDKVEYKNYNNKVCIICPEHGEFEQTPSRHVNGNGCKKCGFLSRTLTRDGFIKKATILHNYVYDYSEVKYSRSNIKIKIICHIHGVFEQLPYLHLNGFGCKNCTMKMTTEKFIEKAIRCHKNDYDYSLVEYVDTNTPIKIICKKHNGIFLQKPTNHLRGNGCDECSSLKTRKLGEYLEICKERYNNKYDYSLIDSDSLVSDKVKIVCPDHGEFEQTLISHYRKKYGCPFCAGKRMNNKIFIKNANLLHNNFYDYSLVDYKNSKLNIDIRCPDHGIFKQNPSSHLSGAGCPVCKLSRGESRIVNFLIKNSIEYKSQYKFIDCKSKIELPFDFFIPSYNICIEYNGIQHYQPVDFFGGQNGHKDQIKRDKIKNDYCHFNNIVLEIIKYNDIIEEKMIEIIIKYGEKNRR